MIRLVPALRVLDGSAIGAPRAVPASRYPKGPVPYREADHFELWPEDPRKSPTTRRAAVLCGGGDAPGMNAAVYGFALALSEAGWEPWCALHGWSGLTDPEGIFLPLTKEFAGEFYTKGGAMPGTGKRNFGPLNDIPGVDNPRENALRHLQQFEGGLFVIGGGGSGWTCEHLLNLGVRVVFTPGTIDGDILHMESIGFASASAEGAQDVRKIATSGSSCARVMVTEVMGARRGALPLQVGIAGQADYVIIPEVETDVERNLLPRIRDAQSRGRGFTIVVGEGTNFTFGDGKRFLTEAMSKIEPAQRQTGPTLARILSEDYGIYVEYVAPRYLLRGGTPLATDVARGLAAGLEAGRLIVRGKSGVVIPPDTVPRRPYRLKGFFTSVSTGEAFTRFLVKHWTSIYGDL